MLPGPEGFKTNNKIDTNIGKKKVNLPTSTQTLRFKKMYKHREYCLKPKMSQSITNRLKFKLSARSLSAQAAQTAEESSSICRVKIQSLKLFHLDQLIAKPHHPLCIALQVRKELVRNFTSCSPAHSILLYQDTK